IDAGEVCACSSASRSTVCPDCVAGGDGSAFGTSGCGAAIGVSAGWAGGGRTSCSGCTCLSFLASVSGASVSSSGLRPKEKIFLTKSKAIASGGLVGGRHGRCDQFLPVMGGDHRFDDFAGAAGLDRRQCETFRPSKSVALDED